MRCAVIALALLMLCSCGPVGVIPALAALAGGSGGDGEKPPPPPLPGKATNPNPPSGAGAVAVTTDLSWDAADRAESYNVYFGTDATAVETADTSSPEFQGNQTDLSYDPPGNLAYDTTYYWRIDSVNPAGTTKGNVWSFTAESTPVTPPDKVTGPDPANTALDVPIDTILSWSAASGAESFDVYFGTVATAVANATPGSAEFMGNQAELSYNPGPLSYNADYYWRIDSINLVDTTKGDLWSFTTISAPPVADFAAIPTSGIAPLDVQFTDASTSVITSWDWDFGDSGISTEQNPLHTYNSEGTYTVSLTVTGPGGSNNLTKTDYISVTPPPPVADFEASPTSGTVPLTVSFTDLSTGLIDTWSWSFGDGGTSSDQHPSYEYTAQGLYTVSLTITGPGGSDNLTKTDYITVTALPPTWTQKFPIDKPFARYDHAMAYDSKRGVVVLFGGNTGTVNDETWEWDGVNWTQKFPVDKPSNRYMHAMAYDSNRGVVVLFAGNIIGGSGLSDETWEWDGANWTQKSPIDTPPARRLHAMAYDSARGVVVVFGGDLEGAANADDTWEWDGTNWTEKSPIDKPSARYWHRMAYDSYYGVVVLFGGYAGGYNDETWEWDGVNWTEKLPTDKPSGRAAHAMAYDSARGVVVLFGGRTSAAVTDETWEWDGVDWTQKAPTDKPSVRQFHAMAYDSANNAVVLFGGQGGPTSDETWEYR